MFLGVSPASLTRPRMVGGASAPATPTDPYFDAVVSLLHFDTGNTTITDVKGKTWTAVGDASANGTAKYGAYALALDGTGDYITVPTDADFNWGTGNWTFEGWFNAASLADINMILHLAPRNTNDSTATIMFRHNVDGLKFWVGNTAGTGWIDNNGHGNGTILTTGVWYHIALVRNGSSYKSYVAGVEAGSATNANAMYVGTGATRVGALAFSTLYEWNGLIDDVRFTKGVARYTANFTPPTAPFPDTQTPNVDAYFGSVTSLLNFDTDLTDAIGNTWTATGDASVVDGQLELDGIGDWITTPSSAGLSLSTGDFTLEAIGTTDINNIDTHIVCWDPNSNVGSVAGILFRINGAGKLNFLLSNNGTTFQHNVSGATTVTTGVEHHFALTRSGDTFTMWLDGVSQGTASQSGALYDGTAANIIGRLYFSTSYEWNGRFKAFRLTKGVARYTANFTPPTGDFPTS